MTHHNLKGTVSIGKLFAPLHTPPDPEPSVRVQLTIVEQVLRQPRRGQLVHARIRHDLPRLLSQTLQQPVAIEMRQRLEHLVHVADGRPIRHREVRDVQRGQPRLGIGRRELHLEEQGRHDVRAVVFTGRVLDDELQAEGRGRVPDDRPQVRRGVRLPPRLHLLPQSVRIGGRRGKKFVRFGVDRLEGGHLVELHLSALRDILSLGQTETGIGVVVVVVVVVVVRVIFIFH
mmetsp:Transcript_26296/g.52398  ORF Transcript_26296/g.52398 Transcript_26296/m.52398 type:complete len:231 (+) Transcript_26296:232-924(+)